MVVVLIFACAGAPQPTDSAIVVTDPAYVAPFKGVPLAAPALLRRASLDLRGVVPTEQELSAVEADPAVVDALIDAFLADPRYEERLVDILGEKWLTRADDFNVRSREVGFPPEQDFAYLRSVGEEPLRLMAHIGARDLPWTDVVTADYTMANDITAQVWPLEFTEAGEGWRKAVYTDGRPAGGIAMTNGLWWRYYTTPNNYSRSRAAAIARLFLCEDFLIRPIQFEAVALLDRESLNEAIRTVPACVGCHSTLDPLAASLFGFWWFELYAPAELSVYHPEREYLGEYYLDTEMAYYGTPMSGASDLGLLIASDDRFRTCTVRSMAEGLWRRRSDVDDFTSINALEGAFVDGEMRLSALVRAIVHGDDYRVGVLADNAVEADAARLTTLRVLSPEQIEKAVADLTGFTWRYAGYDQLTNDIVGHRILAGGMDGLNVTQPERDPTLTAALVMKRLGQAAAQVVVAHDFSARPEDRTLLGDIDAGGDLPGDASFTAELIHLHRRVHGVTPDADTLAADEALWNDVADASTVGQAWASVVSVLFRDPAFWTY